MDISNMSKIGFGTWKLLGKDGIESIKTAIDCGFRYIDTAQMYDNEEIVGIAINDRIKNKVVERKDLFIATKLDNNIRGYDATINAINSSLYKLKLDYLDCFMLHWPKPRKYLNNWEKMNLESWKAMEDMVMSGKIRYLGVCNFLEHHFEKFLPKITVKPLINQLELHPYYYQNEIISFCKKNNIIVEAWSPIANGICLKDNNLYEIAKRYNKSISQICIRYAIQNNTLPIVKASTKEHIQEDLSSLNFEIVEHDMKFIDSLRCETRVGRHPDDE